MTATGRGARGPRPAVLGIDIGGTKLAAGVLLPDGVVAGFGVVESRAERGPDEMIERTIDLARATVDASGIGWGAVALVGIGCGGPLDPATGIVHEPPNLPGWVAVPLVRRVEAALGRPTTLENDATAALLGELWYGGGRGLRDLVYLTISTGIGGGIVMDGAIRRGATGNAGEFGHLTVAHDAWPCPCGRRGCPEAFASGTNIARRARETVVARGTGGEALLALAGSLDRITAEHVAAAARQGDPLALEVWDASTTVIGALVANLLNAFEPQRVVLGGGVTRAGDLLLDPVRRIARTALPPAAAALIVLTELGEQLGVVGAGASALDRAGYAAPDGPPVDEPAVPARSTIHA